MNIITQKFKKILKNTIFSLKRKEIKFYLQRQRLKYSYHEIYNYVCVILEHNYYNKRFNSIYKRYKNKLKIEYNSFMHNISVMSSLIKLIFIKLNELYGIQATDHYNIIDSSLIEEKKEENLNQADWNKGRVTTRTKFNKKTKTTIKKHIIGSKIYCFLNENKEIYHAEFCHINDSDQNYLKETAKLIPYLKGNILADRGFSNKLVRQRFKNLYSNQNSIFQSKKQINLISPYQYKQKLKLTSEESKLYKKRWQIETIFQHLKDDYSNNKLNLKGKYSKSIKQAKFYSTLIQYNLSTK